MTDKESIFRLTFTIDVKASDLEEAVTKLQKMKVELITIIRRGKYELKVIR